MDLPPSVDHGRESLCAYKPPQNRDFTGRLLRLCIGFPTHSPLGVRDLWTHWPVCPFAFIEAAASINLNHQRRRWLLPIRPIRSRGTLLEAEISTPFFQSDSPSFAVSSSSVFFSSRVFYSAVDVRNLRLPENFPAALPNMKKVFPVFGVVFAFSLLFLSAMLLRNPSMPSPGSNTMGSYPFSWFFPEPNSKISPASSAAVELQKSSNLLQQSEEERSPEKSFSHVSDFSEMEKNASEGNVRDDAKFESVSNDSASVRSIGGHPKCDIFNGRWVRDEEKPYYPVGSCPIIDRDFNCLENGRPDSDFLKWRWRPNDCDIPSLNGTDFLARLRGKRLVFVGDSLNRNMWESLVCILRHSVAKKNRVHEISGRSDFKSKGDFSFIFEASLSDYNCSVDYISSPFLVRQSSVNVGNSSEETLRLDLMDEAADSYQEADVLIFNTGHWWTHEKTSKGWVLYSCSLKHLLLFTESKLRSPERVVPQLVGEIWVFLWVNCHIWTSRWSEH
ncbi:hypothetical protein ACLOJK_032560 [Asimina triloba]